VHKRNPYQFAVRACYARIDARLKYYDRALDNPGRALAVNPTTEGVKRNIELLARLHEQPRYRTI